MVMNKIGLNLSVLNNLSAPNITFNKTAEKVIENLPKVANSNTNNYFGLGVMIPLFLFLVYKIGRGQELINEQFSSIRSVGISAGIVAMIGFPMLNIGYFTEMLHVVIFAGICLLCWIMVYLGSLR